MSDTIRVSVVLENASDEMGLGRAGAAGVRRVVTEALVDTGDGTRATALCVPEDLVARLGLRERDGIWDERPRAGPIMVRVAGRCTIGECLVEALGSAVRIGSMTLSSLDLIPDPVTRTLRPGTGIRV